MSHVTAASFPKSTLLKHPLNEDLLSFMHSPPSAGTRSPPPRLPPPPPHSSPPVAHAVAATGGGRENKRFGATTSPIAPCVHSIALPARSGSTSPTAATPSPSTPNARPPRRACPPATGGGRDNQRFGATASPITPCGHSIALPTRSASTSPTGATPSPSAARRSTAPPRRPARRREAVATSRAPPSPRCVRWPRPWRRASKTVLVPRLRHARIPRVGRDPVDNV